MATVNRPERAGDQPAPGQPLAPDMSLGQLFAQMTSELGTLVRQEVELAKVETKEEVSRAAKAAGLLAGAGLVAHMAWLFASLALAWLLDQWINRALAFAIVAVLYAAVAAVMFATGRARIKQVDPVPRQTVDTLKEDAEWVKAQRS